MGHIFRTLKFILTTTTTTTRELTHFQYLRHIEPFISKADNVQPRASK